MEEVDQKSKLFSLCVSRKVSFYSFFRSFPPSLLLSPYLRRDNGRRLVLGPWAGPKQLADLRVCLQDGASPIK